MPGRVALGVLAAALAASFPAAAASTSTPLSPSESSLLQAMNVVRTSRGLAPLRVDRRLVRAARGHSADMLHRQYFAHGALMSRIHATGARGPVYGENIAWTPSTSAQWIVSHWLASPSHRAILLRAGFRRVGVGALRGSFGGSPAATVVTTDFAGS
jgi:uncharacterized protein YkwD